MWGRIWFHEGVFDHDGNYFEESPIVEVFDNFDAAKTKLKEYAIKAYNNLKKYEEGYIVDDDFIKETTEEDLFSWYYMWSEEEWEDWKGEKPAADNKKLLGTGTKSAIFLGHMKRKRIGLIGKCFVTMFLMVTRSRYCPV